MRSTDNTTIVWHSVQIPVQICKAEKSSDIRLESRSPDGDKVKQIYVDSEGTVVPRSEMIKGLQTTEGFKEVPKGELSHIDDLCSLESIEIEEFTEIGELPIERFTGTYWVQGDSKGDLSGLATLHRALKETGTVAIAKWSPRNRQKLVVLYPVGDSLALITMAYQENWRGPDQEVLAHTAAEVDDENLAMAKKIISETSGGVVTAYEATDEVLERRKELIGTVIGGATVISKPLQEKPEPIDTLKNAFGKSLAEVSKRSK